jgi:hypothetical protein
MEHIKNKTQKRLIFPILHTKFNKKIEKNG